MRKLLISNIPIFTILTAVWLILLALSGLIAIFIVPVSPSIDSEIILAIIGGGKIFISLIVVLGWLIGWYKIIDYLFKFEIYAPPNVVAKDD